MRIRWSICCYGFTVFFFCAGRQIAYGRWRRRRSAEVFQWRKVVSCWWVTGWSLDLLISQWLQGSISAICVYFMMQNFFTISDHVQHVEITRLNVLRKVQVWIWTCSCLLHYKLQMHGYKIALNFYWFFKKLHRTFLNVILYNAPFVSLIGHYE